MRRALALAARAGGEGEVPVGAVVVRGGVEVGAGANAPIRDADPTAHAEINAIRAASRATGNYRLTGTTLYATMEPCVMCAGAIVHARVERVVYGTADERWGGAGSVFDILGCGRLNHHPRDPRRGARLRVRPPASRFFSSSARARRPTERAMSEIAAFASVSAPRYARRSFASSPPNPAPAAGSPRQRPRRRAARHGSTADSSRTRTKRNRRCWGWPHRSSRRTAQ